MPRNSTRSSRLSSDHAGPTDSAKTATNATHGKRTALTARTTRFVKDIFQLLIVECSFPDYAACRTHSLPHAALIIIRLRSPELAWSLRGRRFGLRSRNYYASIYGSFSRPVFSPFVRL